MTASELVENAGVPYRFPYPDFSKLTNRACPCGKPSARGIRLHKLLGKGRASNYFNWQNALLANIPSGPPDPDNCLSKADLCAER